jgi:hypothetical protein
MAMIAHPTSGMTSNNAPSPYVEYDDYSAGSDPLYKCFDSSDSSFGAFYTYSTTNLYNNCYVTLDVGDANKDVLTKYYVKKPLVGGVIEVNSWTLAASTDNSNWTDIDTQYDLSVPFATEFTINGSTVYRYFKFYKFSAGYSSQGYSAWASDIKIYLGTDGTPTPINLYRSNGIMNGILKGVL